MGADNEDEGQYGESIEEMHDKAMLENELLGIKLKHMLILGGMVLFFVVVLITLWNYCAGDKEECEYSKKQPGAQTVVAREIRPGLILVHGYPTQEETFRIVAEYDAMQSGIPKLANYGSAGECHSANGLTSHFYQQPAESIIFPMAPPAPNGSNERLVELGPSRPPPYAMDYQRPLR